jgi:hypothetical protein
MKPLLFRVVVGRTAVLEPLARCQIQNCRHSRLAAARLTLQVALELKTDRWRRICAETFHQLRLPLATSEAVLAQLFHLVGDSRTEMEAAWRFLRAGACLLHAIEDSELPEIHALMSRYWDRPMDFADATLVHLAKRESLNTIFTVDFDHFETYRIHGRRRFRVLPMDRP